MGREMSKNCSVCTTLYQFYLISVCKCIYSSICSTYCLSVTVIGNLGTYIRDELLL